MSETTTSPDLEVPGEPGVYWCARHKNVKTRLRCGRCEKPICPKCTKMGPTGARCPDCYSNRDAHIFQVAPWQYALAFAASMVLGVVGVVLVRIVGIYLVFFAPVIGTFFGKAVTTVTRGKRGTRLAIVASIGTAIGALVPLAVQLITTRAMMAHINPNAADPTVLVGSVIFDIGYVLLFLVFVIPALWWWIR